MRFRSPVKESRESRGGTGSASVFWLLNADQHWQSQWHPSRYYGAKIRPGVHPAFLVVICAAKDQHFASRLLLLCSLGWRLLSSFLFGRLLRSLFSWRLLGSLLGCRLLLSRLLGCPLSRRLLRSLLGCSLLLGRLLGCLLSRSFFGSSLLLSRLLGGRFLGSLLSGFLRCHFEWLLREVSNCRLYHHSLRHPVKVSDPSVNSLWSEPPSFAH